MEQNFTIRFGRRKSSEVAFALKDFWVVVDSPLSAGSEGESYHTPAFTPQKDNKHLQTVHHGLSLETQKALGIHCAKH